MKIIMPTILIIFLSTYPGLASGNQVAFQGFSIQGAAERLTKSSTRDADENKVNENACSAVADLQDHTASFVFPGVSGTNWTWYRDTTEDNNLEYAWTISLEDGGPPISHFGAYLWKFPGSKQQDGTLEALLRKCQHSVFDNSGKLNNFSNAEVKVNNGVVTIFVDNIKTFSVLFRSRPLNAYFNIRAPGRAPILCKAKIDYQGSEALSPISEPPEEVQDRGLGHNDVLVFGNPGDFKTLYADTKKMAEQGDAEKQMRLGLMYEKGMGVEKDDAEAATWYRKAAEQGDSTAQISLGSMYKQGRGVSQDYSEAFKWYSEAASKGATPAQYEIATMYDWGLGVQQNHSEAAKWYRKVAEKGFVLAQYNLAWMYENGLGVAKDYAEALKWYRRAAEQGFPKAQTNLGAMYADGFGVPQDYAEAVKWYLKAAKHDYPVAQSNLGIAYSTGKGVAQGHVEAVKWFIRAAAQGDALAQFRLGTAYAKGEGVAQDLVQAYMWLILANKQDFEWAVEMKNTVAAKMTKSQIDEAQRIAREWKPKGKE